MRPRDLCALRKYCVAPKTFRIFCALRVSLYDWVSRSDPDGQPTPSHSRQRQRHDDLVLLAKGIRAGSDVRKDQSRWSATGELGNQQASAA